MKRRLLLAALVLGVGAFVLVPSSPPVPITAGFVGRTNYANGFTGCLLALTNVSTNPVLVLVPMDLATRNERQRASGPPHPFFCPVQLPAHSGKVVPFLQTEAHQPRMPVHFGGSRDSSGLVYRLRRWMHLPRGQPRDFLTNPRTLMVELPPD